MYLMKDITRDGDAVLRQEAGDVSFPLSEQDKRLADDMMEYLVISQDEKENEKYKLRPGVGLAAPQVGVSKRMAAILVPGEYEDDQPLFKGVICNPVIISHSVQNGALDMGEGCLSVDKDIPGFVKRHDRITVRFQNLDGDTVKLRLKDYPAIVFQHEIDHLHGILYYDHIDKSNPWNEDSNTKYIK